MAIVSLAACLRRSYNFTSGNGTVVEKNVIVSQCLVVLTLGIKHFTKR